MGLPELAIASLATSVMGTGMSVVGGIQQGQQQKKAAQAQAQVAANNAAIAEQNAKDAIVAGQNEEQRARMEHNQRLGALRAEAGASGIDVGTGSALDAMGDASMMKEIEALKGEVAGSASRHGWSAEVYQQKVNEAINAAYAGVIQREITTNPEGARALYEKYAPYLAPQTAYGLDHQTKAVAAGKRVATGIEYSWQQGQQGQQGGPAGASPGQAKGTKVAALMPIIFGIESNGKDFNTDGSIVTSPKGAQGKAQVMPTTQADPGFGVRPAQDDSLEEKERVGADYFAAMLERYGGNEVLAAAAYNAGPARVDDWIQKYGDPRRGADLRQWVEKIPFAETQNYVRELIKRAGEKGVYLQSVTGDSAGFSTSKPFSPEANFAQGVARLKADMAAGRVDPEDGASAKGKTLTQSQIAQRLVPLIYHSSSGTLGVDVLHKGGSVDTMPISCPEGTALSDIASITGLHRDLAEAVAESIHAKEDTWKLGDQAEYSFAKIKAAVPGFLAEQSGIDESFVRRWLLKKEQRGEPISLQALREEFEILTRKQNSSRPWGM